MELQNQEKIFQREAQRINAWDRVLAENGDKVIGREWSESGMIRGDETNEGIKEEGIWQQLGSQYLSYCYDARMLLRCRQFSMITALETYI